MVFDFARISASNGWAMALTGAVLVMLGLATLSLIISQLHKIISFFEKAPTTTDETKHQGKLAADTHMDADYLMDPEVTVKLYQALTADLGDPFDLAKLYQLAVEDQLLHPHLTLRTLRESGWLVPAGEGTFTWKSA